MSYILDALKRANAQRELGVVPNLYAQTSLQREGVNASRSGRKISLTMLAVVSIALLAVAAWWAMKQSAVPPEKLTSAGDLVPKGGNQGTANTSSLFNGAPAATPQPTPAPETASPPVSTAAPVLAKLADASAYPQPIVLPTTPRPVVAAASQSAPIATPAQKPGSKIPMLSQLPADIRQAVPPVTINGLIFSANPAQRMVILNGQLTQEGQKVTAELSLERIHSKSIELSFRGTRFELQAQ